MDQRHQLCGNRKPETGTAVVEDSNKTINTRVVREIQVLSNRQRLREWRALDPFQSLSDDTEGRQNRAGVDFALERRSTSEAQDESS